MSTCRPILMSGPLVTAILEGRKTQMRRVMRPQPLEYTRIGSFFWARYSPHIQGCTEELACPYGFAGDTLWVRETFAKVNSSEGPALFYRADGHLRNWRDFSKTFGPDYGAGPSMDYDAYPGDYCMWWSDLWAGEPDHTWTPSIHMPRWASRLTLRVTDIRVERVQDISDDDARAEGLSSTSLAGRGMKIEQPDGSTKDGEFIFSSPTYAFTTLWNDINGKRPGCAWTDNPWVWVVEFERVKS